MSLTNALIFQDTLALLVVGPIDRIVCSVLALLWLEQVGSCSGEECEEMLHD